MSNQTFCFKCGTKVEADTIICPICGDQLRAPKLTEERLEQTVAQDVPDTHSATPEGDVQEPSPTSTPHIEHIVLLEAEKPKELSTPRFIAILSTVFVVGLAVAIGMMINNRAVDTKVIRETKENTVYVPAAPAEPVRVEVPVQSPPMVVEKPVYVPIPTPPVPNPTVQIPIQVTPIQPSEQGQPSAPPAARKVITKDDLVSFTGVMINQDGYAVEPKQLIKRFPLGKGLSPIQVEQMFIGKGVGESFGPTASYEEMKTWKGKGWGLIGGKPGDTLTYWITIEELFSK